MAYHALDLRALRFLFLARAEDSRRAPFPWFCHASLRPGFPLDTLQNEILDFSALLRLLPPRSSNGEPRMMAPQQLLSRELANKREYLIHHATVHSRSKQLQTEALVENVLGIQGTCRPIRHQHDHFHFLRGK